MCESAKCLEQIQKQIEKQKTYKDALQLANESGQWVAICKTYEGVEYIRADQLQPGNIVIEYVSPKL